MYNLHSNNILLALLTQVLTITYYCAINVCLKVKTCCSVPQESMGRVLI